MEERGPREGLLERSLLVGRNLWHPGDPWPVVVQV
jgi:hypothetical protein